MPEDTSKRNSSKKKEEKRHSTHLSSLKTEKKSKSPSLEKRVKKEGYQSDDQLPKRKKHVFNEIEDRTSKKDLKKRESQESNKSNEKRSSVNESFTKKNDSMDLDNSSSSEKVDPSFQRGNNVSRLYFRVVECKDVGEKPKNYFVSVLIDQKQVYQSSTTKKSLLWTDQGRLFSVEDAEAISINLVSKGILSSIRGSITLDLKDIQSEYPYNRWFKLENKKGDRGFLHIQLQLIPPHKDPSAEDFTFPLHHLIKNDNISLFEKCMEEEFTDEFAQDERGFSILHMAVELNSLKFVKLLLKRMDKTRAKALLTKKGETALHVACASKSDKKIIQLLIKNGYSISSKDNQGNMPIHIAAIHNHFEAIDILESNGSKLNKLNRDKNTPLACALLNHSPESVTNLTKLGSNVYIKVIHDLTVWELSQRKDLVNSEPRQCFMDALGIYDPREFLNRKEFPTTKVYKSKSLSLDYLKSSQVSISVKEKTQAVLLITSVDPLNFIDFPSKASYIVVKSNQGVHNEPDFSRDAISFAGSKPLKIILEPDYYYNIIPYAKKKEVEGKFNLIVQLPEKKTCKINPLVKWKYFEEVEGKWKNKTAGGSQPNPSWIYNPQYEISFPQEEYVRFMVYLSQEDNDANLRLTDGGDHCKVPFNLNIGFYLLDRGGVKTIDQTEGWINSRGVHKEFVIDCSERNHCTVMPSTLHQGEEGKYTLKIFCDSPFSMKKK